MGCGVSSKKTREYASSTPTTGLAVAPTLSIFGGNTRINQNLNQNFTAQSNVLSAVGSYNANTTEIYTDFGALIGVVLQMSHFQLDLNFGGVRRLTSLNGNDFEVDTDVAKTGHSSAIDIGNNTYAFVANLEPRLEYQWNGVDLRLFGGVAFDNKKPGIEVGSYTGNVLSSTSSTPASIIYAPTFSEYIGGGFKWHF